MKKKTIKWPKKCPVCGSEVLGESQKDESWQDFLLKFMCGSYVAERDPKKLNYRSYLCYEREITKLKKKLTKYQGENK